MEEQWVEIEDFPHYLVSNLGRVTNMERKAPVALRLNQFGHVNVGLSRDNKQFTKALAPLVARAFVPKPAPEFNCPIHLDGDRTNCAADNLAWRPRWFAIAYHKQFKLDSFRFDNTELIETTEGKTYSSVREACMLNGIYYADVVRSFVQGTVVYPTRQIFRIASK